MPYSFLNHIFHFNPSRSLAANVWFCFNPSCSADTGTHMCSSSSNEILVNVNFDMRGSILFSIPNGSAKHYLQLETSNLLYANMD